eukprot:5001212-Prymnesium_polylepis.1
MPAKGQRATRSRARFSVWEEPSACAQCRSSVRRCAARHEMNTRGRARAAGCRGWTRHTSDGHRRPTRGHETERARARAGSFQIDQTQP